jgi:hypothetical protein
MSVIDLFPGTMVRMLADFAVAKRCAHDSEEEAHVHVIVSKDTLCLYLGGSLCDCEGNRFALGRRVWYTQHWLSSSGEIFVLHVIHSRNLLLNIMEPV